MLWLALGLPAFLLAGCAKNGLQAMAQQPRYETYEGSRDLPNGASAQVLAPGVVARGHLEDDSLLYTGHNADGTPSEVFPYPITREILARGQAEYDAYCTPCHDFAGSGHGLAVRAGFTQPPALDSEDLRAAPAGDLFATVTFGHGAMPAYGPQIAVTDRWAIVAYVRALQLSQHATLDDVPAEARGQIAPAPSPTP
jgi:mono/diheme cytochrome c family protein